jgi:hypothetical protein
MGPRMKRFLPGLLFILAMLIGGFYGVVITLAVGCR